MKTTSTMNVTDMIRERLAALEPTTLTVVDDSALHAGHAGARSGGGHYRLTIVSSRFSNCSTMQNRRLVYDALGSLMKQEIHALSITASSPESS